MRGAGAASWTAWLLLALTAGCSSQGGAQSSSSGSSDASGAADGIEGGTSSDASGQDARATDGSVPAGEAGASNAAHGTWVLALQESDRAGIDLAFATAPGLVGISARFTWTGLAATMPAPLDYWRSAADQLADGGPPPRLAIRFMAGRNTPSSVIAQAPVSVQDGPDGSAPTLIPSPCLPDGGPNTYFEDAYMTFLDQFATWAIAHDVTIVHLPWYGNLWDELYVGPEVVAACNDTQKVQAYAYASTNLVASHEHLFDRVLAYARTKGITIEYPLSGQGGVSPYMKVLAAYIGGQVEDAGMHDHVFLQSNAWGLDGGIPETTFWACQPTAHAFQELSVMTPDSDWTELYAAVRAANATYVEVYLPSFSEPNSPALADEVAKFAGDPGPWVGCP